MDNGVAASGAGVGVGSGSDGAGVAVVVAVGTRNTHAIDAGFLSGRNLEGGIEGGGVVVRRSANIHDLVAVEGEVVVPVDPDDSTVGVSCSIGDVHIDRVACLYSTHLGVVVAIVGCAGGTLAVVDNLFARTERDVGDTLVINRGGCGLAVAGVDIARNAPRTHVCGAADGADVDVVVGFGSKAGDGGRGSVAVYE